MKLLAPRYDERTFYQKALDSYRKLNKMVDYETFYKEANRIIYIPKYLKRVKAQSKDPASIRLVLNYLVIVVNHFGEDTLTLLYSVSDESVFPELNGMLVRLGLYPKESVVVTIYGERIALDTYNTEVDLFRI